MVCYQALFDPDRDAGGYVVTFPDFGYGVTQGETIEEAEEMAQDLLRCLVRDRIKEERDLPKTSSRPGRKYRRISLPALQTAKVELYRAFRASGMRKSDLARLTGVAKSNVDRFFDLDHASRLDQLETAFRALHKRLTIVVDDAA